MNANQKVYFSDIKKTIISNLNDAENSIYVAVAWLTDNSLVKALENATKRGVSVEIIIYDDRINKKENFRSLYQAGAKIWLSKKMMHNKFCIIDYKTIINGSYNWTYSASTNEENIILTKNSASLSNDFVEQFKEIRFSCKPIDDFFTNDNELFLKYYHRAKPNLQFPFFLRFPKNRFSLEHKYYLVKNDKEEWLFFEYSFFKILQFPKYINRPIAIKSDSTYNHVSNFGSNKDFLLFSDKNHLVEKKLPGGHHSVFLIDRNGEKIGKEITITSDNQRLADNKFLIGNILYNSNLKATHLSCDSATSSSFGIILKKQIFDDRAKPYNKYIGLADFNGNVLLPCLYHKIEKDGNTCLKLTSLPTFYYNTLCQYIRNDWTSSFVSRLPKYYYVYSFEQNKIISKHFSENYNTGKTRSGYQYLSENPELLKFWQAISKANIKFELYREVKQKFLEQNWGNLKTDDIIEKVRDFESTIRTQKTNKSCYVATMAYGDINHPNVQLLRNFRDYYLYNNILGIIFIKIYYSISPVLVILSLKNRFLKKQLSLLVFTIVKFIRIKYFSN